MSNDEDSDKKRKQNRARVNRYYLLHKAEIVKVGMDWPVGLLKRIDEAAAHAGLSRQAWLSKLCEKELGSLQKKKTGK